MSKESIQMTAARSSVIANYLPSLGSMGLPPTINDRCADGAILPYERHAGLYTVEGAAGFIDALAFSSGTGQIL